MDCNMPFLDGYEATKRIRKIFTGQGISKEMMPQIIAITGHVEKEYMKKAVECGMDKVYSKPFPAAEFGKLLFSLKLIDSIPEHLREDSHEE
jgi:CheY-like chemotaxis protein